jgi:hypothetical protein
VPREQQSRPHETIAVLLSALAFAIGIALLGKWTDTDS